MSLKTVETELITPFLENHAKFMDALGGPHFELDHWVNQRLERMPLRTTSEHREELCAMMQEELGINDDWVNQVSMDVSNPLRFDANDKHVNALFMENNGEIHLGRFELVSSLAVTLLNGQPDVSAIDAYLNHVIKQRAKEQEQAYCEEKGVSKVNFIDAFFDDAYKQAEEQGDDVWDLLSVSAKNVVASEGVVASLKETGLWQKVDASRATLTALISLHGGGKQLDLKQHMLEQVLEQAIHQRWLQEQDEASETQNARSAPRQTGG